tara:strand:+ start:121 stop:492 length:372 start_codon:yes stop_codon:yes gene_type:complete
MSTAQKEASKATSKKIKKLKDQKNINELVKATKSVFDKPFSKKKELAMMQLEDALMKGDKSNLSTKGVKKVADAAADDKQLTKSLQKFERDLFKGGGRAMYKSGTRGCKLAMKGKGRAYGKNS